MQSTQPLYSVEHLHNVTFSVHVSSACLKDNAAPADARKQISQIHTRTHMLTINIIVSDNFLERHFECMSVAFDGGKGDLQRAALHIRPPSQLTASAFIIHLAGWNCFILAALLLHCCQSRQSQMAQNWHHLKGLQLPI